MSRAHRRGCALAVAGLLVGLVLGAAPAAAMSGAHPGPVLTDAAPAPGEVARQGASRIRLTFDVPVRVEGSSVAVVDGGGSIQRFTAREAQVGGRVLVFPLTGPLARGRHLIGWEAVGRAGPVTSGAFVAVVDPTGQETITVRRDVTATPTTTLARRVGWVATGTVAVVAVLLVVEAAGRRRARPALLLAAAAAAGAGLVAFGLAGIDADGSLADLVGGGAWGAAAGDGVGRAWALVVALLVTLPAVVLIDPDRAGGRLARGGLAAAVLLGAGLAVATTGRGADAGGSTSAEAVTNDGTLSLVLQPGSAGVNEVHAYRFSSEGAAGGLDADALALTHRPSGIGPLVVPLLRIGPGHLVAAAADLPLSGSWEAEFLGGRSATDPSPTLVLEVS